MPPTDCFGSIDIEDCVGPGSIGPLDRIRVENKVLPRALRRKLVPLGKPLADSFIAGTQSIYIKTWGCSHNNSDGEYMAGLLAVSGYTITGQSECTIIISCWSYFAFGYFLSNNII